MDSVKCMISLSIKPSHWLGKRKSTFAFLPWGCRCTCWPCALAFTKRFIRNAQAVPKNIQDFKSVFNLYAISPLSYGSLHHPAGYWWTKVSDCSVTLQGKILVNKMFWFVVHEQSIPSLSHLAFPDEETNYSSWTATFFLFFMSCPRFNETGTPCSHTLKLYIQHCHNSILSLKFFC